MDKFSKGLHSQVGLVGETNRAVSLPEPNDQKQFCTYLFGYMVGHLYGTLL